MAEPRSPTRKSASVDQVIHDALVHRPEDDAEHTRLRHELEAALLVAQQQAARIVALEKAQTQIGRRPGPATDYGKLRSQLDG